MSQKFPKQVHLREVGLRDGLQSIATILPTAHSLANVDAALETGVTRFDACLGGIGGCPHAPGASGNVAMEDVVYPMRSMQIDTGIDFDALMAMRRQLAVWLQGESLHGSIWKAGLPRSLLAPVAEAVAA